MIKKTAIIISFLAPVVLLAQVSFMENPSLEKASPENASLPSGFPSYLTGKDYASRFKWSEEDARTDQKSLAFNIKGTACGFYWPVSGMRTGKLYKFSFYYKTGIHDYHTGIIRIFGNDGKKSLDAYYPSATQWVQAEVFFQAAEEKGSVGVNINAYENGVAQYRDADGKTVANPILIKGFMDDFDFHEAAQEDFARKNLLQNGDFEAVPDSAPGWNCSPDRIQIDTNEHFSGRQSARIDLNGEKRTDFYSNRMPFKAGGFYFISFAVKASGQMIGNFGFCMKYPIGEWRVMDVSLNRKWQEFSYIVEMPRKEDGILMCPEMYWEYRKKYAGDEFTGCLIFMSARKKAEKGKTAAWEDGSVWMDKCVIKMISDKPALD